MIFYMKHNYTRKIKGGENENTSAIEKTPNQEEERSDLVQYTRKNFTIDHYEYTFLNDAYLDFMNESILQEYADKAKDDKGHINFVRKFVYGQEDIAKNAFQDDNILKIIFLFKYHYTKSMGFRFDYFEVIFWVFKKLILDVDDNQKKYEKEFEGNLWNMINWIPILNEFAIALLDIMFCIVKMGNVLTNDVDNINQEIINDLKEGKIQVGGDKKTETITYFQELSDQNKDEINKREFQDFAEWDNSTFTTYVTNDSLQHQIDKSIAGDLIKKEEDKKIQPIHFLNKYMYLHECNELFEEEIKFMIAKSFVDYMRKLYKINFHMKLKEENKEETYYINRLLKHVLTMYYNSDNSDKEIEDNINNFVDGLEKIDEVGGIYYDSVDYDILHNDQEKSNELKLTKLKTQIAKRSMKLNEGIWDQCVKMFVRQPEDPIFPKDILNHATSGDKTHRYPNQDLIGYIISFFKKYKEDKKLDTRLSVIMLEDLANISSTIKNHIQVSNSFLGNKTNLNEPIANLFYKDVNILVDRSFNAMFAFNVVRIVRKAITTDGKRDQAKVDKVIKLMAILSRQFFEGMSTVANQWQNWFVGVVGFAWGMIELLPFISSFGSILVGLVPFLGPVFGFCGLLAALPFFGSYYAMSIREVYGSLFIHLFLVYNVWLNKSDKHIDMLKNSIKNKQNKKERNDQFQNASQAETNTNDADSKDPNKISQG